MKKQKFSVLEAQVLNCLVNSLYAEPGFSDVDAKDIAVALGRSEQSVGGVISQLVQKGVVFVEEYDANFQVHKLIYLQEGAYHYHAEWAEAEGIEVWEIEVEPA